MNLKKLTKAELVKYVESARENVLRLERKVVELQKASPENAVIRLVDWCQENEIYLTAIDVDGIKLGFAVPPGQPLVPQHPESQALPSEEGAEKPKPPTNYLGAFAEQNPPPQRFNGQLDEG